MKMVQNLNASDMEPLRAQAIPLMTELAHQIKDQPTLEHSGEDQDFHLQGNLMVLKALAQKFPQQKQPIGAILLKYLLTDGLFEIPTGNDRQASLSTPKCKNVTTRGFALGLVQVLARDCQVNLEYVMKFMWEF